MTTRLTSSGIRRSNERRPDSTWPTGDADLGRHQRAGQRRVGVAVDQHQVGPLGAPAPAPAPTSIAPVCWAWLPEPALELVVGRRQPELLEEDAGQLVVVVLAGVHEHVLGRRRAARASAARP